MTLPLSALSLALAPMSPADVEAVVGIERQSFSTPWTPGMFLSELRPTSRSRFLVARTAEDNETIVGYIGYQVVVDEMHILLLAVTPVWRQRGVAARLLEDALEEARQHGCLKATLEVRVSNRAAQRLYYRCGFAPVGTRPRYYARPVEDALILWRDPL